jgi:hypothetical protein
MIFFSWVYTKSIFVIVLFQAFTFLYPQVVQSDSLHSTFPGRRVGGGTRGECASRIIIHLVPKSSQYSISSDAQALIGLVQGPSESPTGLDLSFRPLRSNGNEEQSQQKRIDFSFKPSDAALILLSPRFKNNQTYIWESSFNCQKSILTDEFDFITSGSPPALSLLTTQSNDLTNSVSQILRQLKKSCGGSIDTVDVLKQFGLIDLLSNDWPVRLPIYCP